MSSGWTPPFPYEDDEITALVAAAQRVAGLAGERDPDAMAVALEDLDRMAHSFCIGVDSRWAGVIEVNGDGGYVDDEEDPTMVSPTLRTAVARYVDMVRIGRLRRE